MEKAQKAGHRVFLVKVPNAISSDDLANYELPIKSGSKSQGKKWEARCEKLSKAPEGRFVLPLVHESKNSKRLKASKNRPEAVITITRTD